MLIPEDVRIAYARIAAYIRPTPLLQARFMQTLPKSPFASLWFKLENHQVTGSFKARGATNKIRSLPENAIEKGIVTASNGNHGAAIAYVGHQSGVPTRVYLSKGAVPGKAEKIEAWGAEVHVVGDVFDEAHLAALAYAEESGAQYIHPFDDPAIVAGQGTVGLEMFEAQRAIDTVIVAAGGGGLISGVSIMAAESGIRVIGVEPVGAPTLYESKKAGDVVELASINTRVGTLAPRKSAPLNVGLVNQHVDEIVLVTDDEMLEASRWLWFEFGIAADLAGSAATAALLSGKANTAPYANVGVIVCGAGSDGAQ